MRPSTSASLRLIRGWPSCRPRQRARNGPINVYRGAVEKTFSIPMIWQSLVHAPIPSRFGGAPDGAATKTLSFSRGHGFFNGSTGRGTNGPCGSPPASAAGTNAGRTRAPTKQNHPANLSASAAGTTERSPGWQPGEQELPTKMSPARDGRNQPQSLPAPAPANACHKSSRTNSHDSGASVVRYAFTARDVHPRHPAGLSLRFSPIVNHGQLPNFRQTSVIDNLEPANQSEYLLFQVPWNRHPICPEIRER